MKIILINDFGINVKLIFKNVVLYVKKCEKIMIIVMSMFINVMDFVLNFFFVIFSIFFKSCYMMNYVVNVKIKLWILKSWMCCFDDK